MSNKSTLVSDPVLFGAIFDQKVFRSSLFDL